MVLKKEDNIYTFIAICLLSGNVKLPRRRMYWMETSKEVYNYMVSNSIRRDTFELILRCLHFSDNALIDLNDKYYKVRPIFDHVNDVFKMLPPEEHSSIDESMVPYFGPFNTKQFIRCKPVRFGYKLWSLTTSSGYLLHAKPYCGKSTKLDNTGLGQGTDVILGF